ncbi:MAG TPA: indole-3-glycerol phosphate synthase TrpC [Bacteroidales bacterium]|nr:indole-3-glycerol phosphate synthase TrpC [Bacteroidales bacterium]
MMKFLERIKEVKEREVALLKQKTPGWKTDSLFTAGRKTLSLSESLRNHREAPVIAEYKRRSPSKGILNLNSPVSEVAEGYESAGAAGISVLTENVFFGGSAGDLSVARNHTRLPILRKDFIIDEIQIYEASGAGADAVLLIAALLGKKRLKELSLAAWTAGLEVVLEIHSEKELECINDHVSIIGVNNRDLNTLKVDINTSVKLAGRIPAGFMKIAESGISSPGQIAMLMEAGYDGFLVGERFMANPDPVKAFRLFIGEVKQNSGI